MITDTIDSSLTKKMPNDTTTKFVEEIQTEKLQYLVDTIHLIKPTPSLLELSNQTQVDSFNGESISIDINLENLLLIPPLPRQAREYFNVKQKWEGYVLEVSQDVFLARLMPIVGEGSDMEAEIYLEEVDAEDHKLVEPGAVFYWSIGYLIKPSGRYRASLIRFRRLPPRSKRDLDNARLKAVELMSLFDAK